MTNLIPIHGFFVIRQIHHFVNCVDLTLSTSSLLDNTMAKTNQELERYYFEMFSKDYQLPEGTISYGDKPDVILEGERKIGIEITNFFLKSGSLPECEQVQHKAREAVVLKAQQIYLENGGRTIELSFSFNKLAPIRNQEELAYKIATIASNIEDQSTGSVHKVIFKDIPELSFVYLNAKEYEDPKWRVVHLHSGTLMSMEKLREIVSSKEQKSKSYEHCDAHWLLVVVDFADRAQDQEIQIGEEKIDSTVFERVFVYKTYFSHVLEAK